MDLAVRAVQMTLSAVLLGMLASVSDDNQRAAPPESGGVGGFSWTLGPTHNNAHEIADTVLPHPGVSQAPVRVSR
jgi:hypothetical protein